MEIINIMYKDFKERKSGLHNVAHISCEVVMADLTFSVENEWWLFFPRTGYADQPTVERPLATLLWLACFGIENLLVFALRCYLFSCLCSVSSTSFAFLKSELFPYNKKKFNDWFLLPSPKNERKKLNVINVNSEGEKFECYKSQHGVSNFPLSLSNDDYEVFFHGTSHESAKSIIENNIILSKGDATHKADFSHGWGFYLAKDFENTLRAKWRSHRPRCSAVLVFRVPRADLREAGIEGLDLQGESKESAWQRIIKQFRTPGTPSRRFLDKLEPYHFIEGPLFGEGQGLTNPIPNRGSYQLCVRSLDCAKLFDQNLHSVLFLEP